MTDLSPKDDRKDSLIAALARAQTAWRDGRHLAHNDLLLLLDKLTHEAVTIFSDRAYRRLILRRIRAEHYSGMSRTVAARQIAAAWSRWRADDPAPRGTLAAFFALMAMRGITPKGWRTITDDLDAGFDWSRQ